ncbi:hypothetical protein BCR44DRAFT_1025588 [Catenaria anguillulae PL171]|uniref:Uncharacterized protein n=1 Tax=Catenaria anguillulae PL171 TaxID=765915 RepID=A0A1Y2HT61_9FUNG|nr:hypothetical protein BCR44DRAFT_1025588 [Catenaria anguillulae PL171]
MGAAAARLPILLARRRLHVLARSVLVPRFKQSIGTFWSAGDHASPSAGLFTSVNPFIGPIPQRLTCESTPAMTSDLLPPQPYPPSFCCHRSHLFSSLDGGDPTTQRQLLRLRQWLPQPQHHLPLLPPWLRPPPPHRIWQNPQLLEPMPSGTPSRKRCIS